MNNNNNGIYNNIWNLVDRKKEQNTHITQHKLKSIQHSLADLLRLSHNKNRPVSVIDYSNIIPESKEWLKKIIRDYMTKDWDKFWYFDENWNFTAELEEVFAQHILPISIEKVQNYWDLDFMRMLKNSSSSKIKELLLSNPDLNKILSVTYNGIADNDINYIEKLEIWDVCKTEDQILELIAALFDECSDEQPENHLVNNISPFETYYRKTRKRVLRFIYAMIDLYSHYRDLEKAYIMFEKTFAEIIEEARSKIWANTDMKSFETLDNTNHIAGSRQKEDERILNKMMRKPNMNWEDVMGDIFGARITSFLNDIAKREWQVEWLIQIVLDKFSEKCVKINLETQWNFLSPIVQERVEKYFEIVIGSQNEIEWVVSVKPEMNFQTIKIEWEYTPFEDKTNKYGFEFQITAADSANENSFMNHIFYEAWNDIEIEVRHHPVISISILKERLKKQLKRSFHGLHTKLLELKTKNVSAEIFEHVVGEKQAILFTEEDIKKYFAIEWDDSIDYILFETWNDFFNTNIVMNGKNVWVGEPHNSIKTKINPGWQKDNESKKLLNTLTKWFINYIKRQKRIVEVKGIGLQRKFIAPAKIANQYKEKINEELIDWLQCEIPLQSISINDINDPVTKLLLQELQRTNTTVISWKDFMRIYPSIKEIDWY